MKVVLTPLTYGARVYPDGDIIFGITPWIGAMHVSVNELGEANITQVIVPEGPQNTRQWWASVYAELRDVGVKCGVWTKITAGRKRTVRMMITENCTPGDVAYFKEQVRIDRLRKA